MHLYYCDVIYHQPTYDDFYNKYYSERAKSDPIKTKYHFTNKIEAVQYNAALAIRGCVRGPSREKVYFNLGLTSLYDRRRFRRLSLKLTPVYLRYSIEDSIRRLQITRTNRDNVCQHVH